MFPFALCFFFLPFWFRVDVNICILMTLYSALHSINAV